ncbi:hypothetical protein [Donghicola tyrosinivorans]|uniref:Cell pole-organizing protein PopZ n=1 Tax=Donghicola tyrosinivorans TaxID=1652492 RepID=A0A2T0WWL5_9RHOB|nr:hypothetical protein [Donghicola tyrosinivorans]PRY91081.1 hypothetical protein CLV74_10494 [Donghicola tyrosinivorans]
MSEANRNLDIEDVLSSIRRLVSEDARKAENAALASVQGQAPSPVPPVNQGERLVLTPALRISEPEAVAEQTEAAAEIADVDEAPFTEVEPDVAAMAEAEQALVLETPFAAPETQVEADEEVDVDVEALAEEDADEEDAAEEVTGDDIADEDVAAMIEAVSDAVTEDAPEESEASEAHDTVSLQQAIHDLSAAVDQDPSDWEAEEGDSFAETSVLKSLPWAESTPDEEMSVHEGRRKDMASEITEGVAEAVTDEVVDKVTRPNFDARKAFTVDAVMEGGPDDEAIEAPVTAAIATALNEDALREVVARLVREELQGELGERITRNVRKLIRREINRALALQELE